MHIPTQIPCTTYPWVETVSPVMISLFLNFTHLITTFNDLFCSFPLGFHFTPRSPSDNDFIFITLYIVRQFLRRSCFCRGENKMIYI